MKDISMLDWCSKHDTRWSREDKIYYRKTKTSPVVYLNGSNGSVYYADTGEYTGHGMNPTTKLYKVIGTAYIPKTKIGGKIL